MPLVKLNRDTKGLWAEALRFDSFLPIIGARDEVVAVKCFLRYFANLGVAEKDKERSFTGYYVVEYRHFADEYKRADGTVLRNAPVAEYVIHRQDGSIVNGGYLSQSMSSRVPFSELPKSMRRAIGRAYPDIRFDKPILLPFADSLGCEIVKWTDGVSSLP